MGFDTFCRVLRRLTMLHVLFITRIYLVMVVVGKSISIEESKSKCHLLSSLQFFEDKIYSQNGEDGILISLLEVIGSFDQQTESFVEFGVEDGSECNTRILREKLKYEGLLMDGGFSNKDINLNKEFITEQNILNLFAKYNVSKNLDVLSIDVDLFDWWILAKIFRHSDYRPRIIIVETNPTLCLNDGIFSRKAFAQMNMEPLVVVHPQMTKQLMWDGTRWAGANPMAFKLLGNAFGYEMVYCEKCGVNCFLVLKSSLPDTCNSFPSLPVVHYPCFGSVRTGGSYPGHEVDRLHRPVLKVDDEFIKTALKDSINCILDPPLGSNDTLTKCSEDGRGSITNLSDASIEDENNHSTSIGSTIILNNIEKQLFFCSEPPTNQLFSTSSIFNPGSRDDQNRTVGAGSLSPPRSDSKDPAYHSIYNQLFKQLPVELLEYNTYHAFNEGLTMLMKGKFVSAVHSFHNILLLPPSNFDLRPCQSGHVNELSCKVTMAIMYNMGLSLLQNLKNDDMDGTCSRNPRTVVMKAMTLFYLCLMLDTNDWQAKILFDMSKYILQGMKIDIEDEGCTWKSISFSLIPRDWLSQYLVDEMQTLLIEDRIINCCFDDGDNDEFFYSYIAIKLNILQPVTTDNIGKVNKNRTTKTVDMGFGRCYSVKHKVLQFCSNIGMSQSNLMSAEGQPFETNNLDKSPCTMVMEFVNNQVISKMYEGSRIQHVLTTAILGNYFESMPSAVDCSLTMDGCNSSSINKKWNKGVFMDTYDKLLFSFYFDSIRNSAIYSKLRSLCQVVMTNESKIESKNATQFNDERDDERDGWIIERSSRNTKPSKTTESVLPMLTSILRVVVLSSLGPHGTTVGDILSSNKGSRERQKDDVNKQLLIHGGYSILNWTTLGLCEESNANRDRYVKDKKNENMNGGNCLNHSNFEYCRNQLILPMPNDGKNSNDKFRYSDINNEMMRKMYKHLLYQDRSFHSNKKTMALVLDTNEQKTQEQRGVELHVLKGSGTFWSLTAPSWSLVLQSGGSIWQEQTPVYFFVVSPLEQTIQYYLAILQLKYRSKHSNPMDSEILSHSLSEIVNIYKQLTKSWIFVFSRALLSLRQLSGSNIGSEGDGIEENGGKKSDVIVLEFDMGYFTTMTSSQRQLYRQELSTRALNALQGLNYYLDSRDSRTSNFDVNKGEISDDHIFFLERFMDSFHDDDLIIGNPEPKLLFEIPSIPPFPDPVTHWLTVCYDAVFTQPLHHLPSECQSFPHEVISELDLWNPS